MNSRVLYISGLLAVLVVAMGLIYAPVQKVTSQNLVLSEELANKVQVIKSFESELIDCSSATCVRISDNFDVTNEPKISLRPAIARSDLSPFPIIVNSIYIKFTQGTGDAKLTGPAGTETIKYKKIRIGENIIEDVNVQLVTFNPTSGNDAVMQVSLAQQTGRGALFPLGADGNVELTLEMDPLGDGFDFTVIFVIEAPESVTTNVIVTVD